jgi:WD40 repeat protein
MGTQLPDGVRLLRTLTGHDDTIGRIGWSPDGHRLATPSTDGTVRIWDADSGVCLRTIRVHHGGTVAAAFDPDGRILATGSFGGTTLWNVNSGELHTTLDTGDCRSVAFSPHNRVLATANDPSGVKLWELSSGAVLHRLTGHDGFVTGLAFDAEGSMLATGSQDRTICECVVAVLLGGSAPGSVLATRCDSRTIWPLGRALSDDLSAVVAGTGLAHQVGLIRSLSAMA